jgi:hypothetical protein
MDKNLTGEGVQCKAIATKKADSDSDDDSLPIAQTLSTTTKTIYEGPTFVPETEEQITSDSDKEQAKTGNVPEQTGQDAVGVKVARDFGELGIFKGEVERVEEERKRFYYNIIYEDGDREEWNEGQYLYGKELREAIDSGRCVKTNADGTDIASSGEESDYSADREERERIKSLKRKRRQPRLSKTKNKTTELSDVLLPKRGEKNVSAEAYDTLNAKQKISVAANVEKQTKKVSSLLLPNAMFVFVSRSSLFS